jgi:ABC-2 type transport system permease protein
MRNIWIVFKREFTAYFTTPLAYVLIVVFTLLSLALTFYFGGFIEAGDASLKSFFSFHPWIYMIFGPAIGMRLWAEENRTGTTELLLTMPLSPWQAIVGKFLAAAATLAATLLCTVGIVITVYRLGEPDGATIFSGYIGSYLIGLAAISLTCAFSAMTRNPITCLLLSVTVCLVLVLLGFGPIIDFLRGAKLNFLADVCNSMSFMWHQAELAAGNMTVQSLVYLLSFSGFFLFLTSVFIRSRRG